jgi:hypothetical protein
MGTFSFRAELLERACELDEVSDAGFDFEATFSRDPDAGLAWVTLSGYSRDASWDGQVVRSVAVAERVFIACGGCVTRVVEDLEVSLLSSSQAGVVGFACPAAPLDGGTPRPDDAGVLAPRAISSGFDSLLACGELRTALDSSDTDAGSCPGVCRACTSRFGLTGTRR